MRSRSSFCCAALSLLTVAFIGAPAHAQRFCAGSNSNLRVMNVNADCWVTAQSASGQLLHVYDMDFATRAKRLASIIQREDPDVVTVQEAQDDACKVTLHQALAVTHPNLLDLHHKPGEKLSGMMVFSKLPFEPFTAPMKGGPAVIAGINNGVDFFGSSNLVAWNNYTSSVAPETGSSGAALMVRIRPPNGCAVNIAMTTLHGKPEVTMDQLRALIVTTHGAAINREVTFVLGDLKLDGDGDALPYVFTDVNGVPHATSFTPWHKYFDPTTADPPDDPFVSSFFRCGKGGFNSSTTCTFTANPPSAYLTDAWGFEWPTTDHGHLTGAIGQTSLSDIGDLGEQRGERADYILHNQPLSATSGAPFICPQRLKRVFFLDPDPLVQNYSPSLYTSVEYGNVVTFSDAKRVSDHFGLVGDFLFSRLARCSPMTGTSFGPAIVSSIVPDTNISMSLGASGNRRHYNWVRIDTAATYSIGTSDVTKGRFEVYHHSDLSTPIPAFHGLSNQWAQGRFTGPVYDLNDPPYFVRFEPQPNATLPAAFTAGIHRHGCTSPISDYCLLTANVDKAASWPASQFVMPVDSPATSQPDAMYFVAAVDRAASGANARVDFRVEVTNSSQFPTSGMRLFNKCGYLVTAGDCGSGTCNPPLAYSPGTYGNDDGDARPDVTGTSGNQTTGAISPATTGTPRLVMLRVRRSCFNAASCIAAAMTVRYVSSLRSVTPVGLTCIDEEDTGSQDDEIHIALTTDASPPGAAVCNTLGGFTNLNRFDENGESNKQHADFPGPWGFGAKTFVNSAHTTLCEEDTSSGNFLGNVSFNAPNVPPVGQSEALISGQFDAHPDAVYQYQFRVKTENPSTQAASCP